MAPFLCDSSAKQLQRTCINGTQIQSEYSHYYKRTKLRFSAFASKAHSSSTRPLKRERALVLSQHDEHGCASCYDEAHLAARCSAPAAPVASSITQNSILRRGAAVLSQSYRPNIHVPNFQFFFSPPTTSLYFSFYQVRQERRISLLIPAYPRQVGRNQLSQRSS